MGIPNLLRFMKPYIQPVHIKKYAGKRVGIDAYSWLHKGAYSCSMEICLNKQGESARRYLRYFMQRIDLLRYHKIIPVVIFDGANIPSKSATEESRRKKREESLILAKEKLKEGNVEAAVEHFRKAVWISPKMAHQLIQILKADNIEFVVAPYEADAQLAYLSTLDSHDGGISAVITEDSDLMAYGCPTIIFKMDHYGHGDEIIMDDVFVSSREDLSFQHFDMELFTGMCVLAGCDFLPSVPGIGIKRAYSLISKHRNIDRVKYFQIKILFQVSLNLYITLNMQALLSLSIDKASVFPEDYCISYQKAIAVFSHARVYDVKSQRVKPLKPLPESLIQAVDGDLDFLGPEISPSLAIAIAEGHFNPITMEAFDRKEIPVKLDIIPKRKTSFSIFSVEEVMEEKTIEKLEVSFDSTKYTREARSLRKLSEQKAFYHSDAEKVIERGDIPENNPFKRKKTKVNAEETVDFSDKKVADVTGVDLIAEIAVEPSKDKLNAKNKCQAVGKGKNGILRFFTRT